MKRVVQNFLLITAVVVSLNSIAYGDEFEWGGGFAGNVWQNDINWFNLTTGMCEDGVPQSSDTAIFTFD